MARRSTRWPSRRTPRWAPLLSGHGLDGRGQIVLGPDTLAQLDKRVGDTVVVSGGGVPLTRLRISGTATLPTIGITQAEPPVDGHRRADPRRTGGADLERGVRAAVAGPNAILVRLRPGVSQAAGLRSLQQIANTYNNVVHSPQMVAEAGPSALELVANVLPVQRPAEIVNYKSMGTMPVILAAAWPSARSPPSGWRWSRRCGGGGATSRC